MRIEQRLSCYMYANGVLLCEKQTLPFVGLFLDYTEVTKAPS